ncbi:hypothetical protein C0J52_04753 [Blattella germanica]|nr:hypothetical protein C0J52_04753 [Blattella germanica]
MDRSDWDDNDENLDEDNDERIEKYSGRDGLIFLIDATKPMFMKQEGEECPIKISLQCCLTTMKNKIISSEKDVAGIVLFGTSKKNNELDVSNIFVLQDLIQPGAESLKKLENIVKSDDFFDHFSDNAFTLNSQRILLFTNNDNPHKCSTAKQIQAMKKALDIGNLNMDLELLHMGKDFNPDLFYKELVQIIKGDNSEDWKIPDPTNKFEELLSRTHSSSEKSKIGQKHQPRSEIFETSVQQGSSQMFTALLQRCIERDVVPVCWYALRHDVAPAQVALVPQKEVLDDSELQELPPGFHVVFLPYLVPNYDRMRNKLGSLSREFLDEVYPPDYVPGEEQKAKKRQLDVETLKVNDLKAYLATEDIKLGGLKKKADLVSKVYEHLGVPQP